LEGWCSWDRFLDEQVVIEGRYIEEDRLVVKEELGKEREILGEEL
jgi:hypothetical protein